MKRTSLRSSPMITQALQRAYCAGRFHELISRGSTVTEAARQIGLPSTTAWRWHQTATASGLPALLQNPSPGRPPSRPRIDPGPMLVRELARALGVQFPPHRSKRRHKAILADPAIPTLSSNSDRLYPAAKRGGDHSRSQVGLSKSHD